MSEIKLLALDLDGTLFNGQKKVSDENKAALKAAREKGVKVVITTGRPLKAIEGLLEELDLIADDEYIITFNGGLVQTTTGRILDKSELKAQDLREIYKVLQPLALPLDVLSEGIVYSVSSQGNHSLYPQVNPMLTFVEVESLEDIPRDIVYNKVVSVMEQDFLDQQITKLPDQLRDKYEVFKSRDLVLEVMPKGVHKAMGLELLIKHLGIQASNVMAMGDEENDLTMLKWAGLGVAMVNGAALVKESANAVTSRSNEQSGVAEAVQKYILSED